MSIRSLRTPILPLFLLVIFLAFAALSACGNGDATFCSGPMCNPGPAPAFLYAMTGSGQILTMTIDQQTGGLGAPASVAGPAASVGMAAAGFQFLYVSDFQNEKINAYAINQTNGLLTPVAGSPFSTGFSVPAGLATNHDGTFLYAGDALQTEGFSINSISGAPTAIPGSPFLSSSNQQVVVSPNGKFLFGTALEAPGGVSAFTVSAATGALTEIPGSPFPIPGQIVAISQPFGIAVDPAGKFVYAAVQNTNQVVGYSVDQITGVLTPVPGSPFATGAIPSFVVVANQYVYVMNTSDQTISGYTFDNASGTLTQVSGSPFAATGATGGLAVNSTGSRLYAAAPGANGILGFAIGAGGSLTALPGSPFPTTGPAVLLTIVQMPTQGG